MKKVLRFVVFLLVLAFIFLNVYVATHTSVPIYTHKASIAHLSSNAVVQQISSFKNWEPMASTNALTINFNTKQTNPLANSIQLNLPSNKQFTIQNQFISDTLVVQHIYGLSGKQASILQWKLNQPYIELLFKEYVGSKQKLLNSVGYYSTKSEYLKNNYQALVYFKNTKVVTPTTELQHLSGLKKEPISDTIIRIPKQN